VRGFRSAGLAVRGGSVSDVRQIRQVRNYGALGARNHARSGPRVVPWWRWHHGTTDRPLSTGRRRPLRPGGTPSISTITFGAASLPCSSLHSRGFFHALEAVEDQVEDELERALRAATEAREVLLHVLVSERALVLAGTRGGSPLSRVLTSVVVAIWR